MGLPDGRDVGVGSGLCELGDLRLACKVTRHSEDIQFSFKVQLKLVFVQLLHISFSVQC